MNLIDAQPPRPILRRLNEYVEARLAVRNSRKQTYLAAEERVRAAYAALRDEFRTLYAAPTSERVQALEEGSDAEIVAAVSANFRNDLDRIMAENPPPETGWLIELVSRLGLPPTWFALGGDDRHGYFTADSIKALRFARKEDAQAYIEDIGWTECIPTEHEWSDPPAALKATP